ncbi:MAG: short-chain dehydrogenase/reductase [Pedobacter sp.]|nr:short-chain dehydrogenase/reductase [Pedobacter sp.]
MNAIITAATKGIGRAISIKLAEQGFNLAICARNEQELKSFAEELSYTGVQVKYLKADCSLKEDVYSFCDFALKELGFIDVLVNNAGTFLPAALLDESDEAFELQLGLNLKSAYYISKRIGKTMRENRSGHIFNICSVASKEIVKNAGTYSVTKTALLCLNNVLRQELAEYNVKVTAILPGSTLTSSWEGTDIPEEKFVQPEDIANTIYHVLNLSTGANVDEVIIRPIQF